MTRFDTWADYWYPGTEVLKNLRNIRDAASLRQFEEEASRARTAEILHAAPIDGDFDREHMKAIHRHLFGDVYEWAGQERTGPTAGVMIKPGPSPDSILAGDYAAQDGYGHQYFPAGEGMLQHFDHHCSQLELADLAKASPPEFVETITEPWGEINAAHLFREGNTRTQVVFFTYFARRHGHDLDFARFTIDPMFRHKFNAGRFLVQSNVDYTLFADALGEVIDAPPSAGAASSDEHPDDYQPMYSDEDYADKYQAE